MEVVAPEEQGREPTQRTVQKIKPGNRIASPTNLDDYAKITEALIKLAPNDKEKPPTEAAKRSYSIILMEMQHYSKQALKMSYVREPTRRRTHCCPRDTP